MMIVYEIVWIYDAKMYVYGFTKLNAATRLCIYVRRVYVMFTNLSTQMSQRDYVYVYNKCIFMFMRLPIQTSQRKNVCMYVCEKVRLLFFSNQMPQRVLLWNPRICLWQMMYVQCFRCHRQDCNSDNLYGQYSLRFSSLLCF